MHARQQRLSAASVLAGARVAEQQAGAGHDRSCVCNDPLAVHTVVTVRCVCVVWCLWVPLAAQCTCRQIGMWN